MLYQLPNGRTIYLSVEQFLDMSDQELHETAYLEHGAEVSSNTSFSRPISTKKVFNEDKSLDYTPDKEDTDTTGPLDITNLPD